MEEISAFSNFLLHFTKKFQHSRICYDFSVTNLSTALSKIAAHKDNMLIFYLHHSADGFSSDFFNFLQDPVVEAVFHTDQFILYCWDIESENLKPKLIQKFKKELKSDCSFIERNKAVVFAIGVEDGEPCILCLYENKSDLSQLRDILTGVETEPVEDENGYNNFENPKLKIKVGLILYGPPTEEKGTKYNKYQQEEIDKLCWQILNHNCMEEFSAFASFHLYFTKIFWQTNTWYNFSIPDLTTALSKVAAQKDNVLILYLHHSADGFSLDFCIFLRDPIIEAVFSADQFILYCWDIESEDLKPHLIQKLKEEIKIDCSFFIEENKAVVFAIGMENEEPYVLHFYDNDSDLNQLRNVLTTGVQLEPMKEEVITPLSYQKMMASNLGDSEYTSFEKTQHEQLKMKIGFALFGPATEEEGRKYNKDQQRDIEKLFQQILNENDAFSKWNGRIVISIIFICAEALDSDKKDRAKKCAKNQIDYNPDSDFIPYPVFILRKCKNKTDPAKACRIIIDHEGRVYNCWHAYLENNRLLPCKMIFPENGRYYSDNEVKFETLLSPACDLSKKIASAGDIASGVTGLLAGGVSVAASSSAVLAAVPLVAAAAPIALPVAAAVGIGSGIYAVGRSIYSLVDRKKHKQSMGLSDSESRAAYINIVGGFFSIGMFGAARTVSFLAGRGIQLGQGTRYVLYGINGISLTVNGIGIGNSMYEAYRARNVSPLVVAQIGASILFFANSLYNFKAIMNIIEESQSQALSEIENSLRSNRHRRTFNKLLKESIRTQGESKGKASVIASIRNMENTDEVMALLTRSNKMLNEQGIRFSAEDGKILLNGHPVDMTNFGSMSRGSQMSFLATLSPIPENLSPTAQAIISQDVQVWLSRIDILYRLANSRSVINLLVNEIFSAFEAYVRDFIMDISKRFFNNVDVAILVALSKAGTNIVVNVVKWLVNMLMNTTAYKKVLNHWKLSLEEINSTVNDLVQKFYCFYTNFIYDENSDSKNKEQRRENAVPKAEKPCDNCSGYYYI